MTRSDHFVNTSRDEAIEATAAAWLAERDGGMSAEDEVAFESWRSADVRHEAAIARLERTWGMLQGLRDFRPEAHLHPDSDLLARPTVRTRAPYVALGAFTVMAASIAMVAWMAWPRAVPATPPQAVAAVDQTYATTAGGYQRVALEDGSKLELNADTEVRVAFVPEQRLVHLLRGEANFVVAKNPQRPFLVEARGVTVRAVGTAFNVRLDEDRIEVLVTHGRVSVEQPAIIATAADNPAPTYPVFDAGQRVIVSTPHTSSGNTKPAIVAEVLAPEAIDSALSWQGPKLVFSETPLAEVVRQFNRSNTTQVMLGDATLGSTPIGGSFRAENVEAFVRLLEMTDDIAVERPYPGMIILRKSVRDSDPN